MLDLPSINFLEERRIDPEIATRYGISTANVSSIKGGSVLVFPYTKNGELISEKFRLLPKEKFWRQPAGARKILWNVDALNDPSLEAGRQPLVITEGELDALAAIQSGFPLAVSVPDGAPPATPRDIDHSGADEQDGRYSFLWDERDKLRRVKQIILATDNDGPGKRLQAELIDRLSAGRCWFLEYPPGCKDLNDVLMKNGEGAVSMLLNMARPCPVRGRHQLEGFPEHELQTFDAGFPFLDRHMRVVPGEFMVLTGIPQHGKSAFALHLLSNLAHLHGWRAAMFSPEMPVMPMIANRLAQISYRCDYSEMQPEQKAWLNDSFMFISDDPVDLHQDTEFPLEFIIETATECVLRDGIRVLLIDPWNEVEHARGRNETMTEYVARGIRMLKQFARRHSVTVIVVAHPTKMERDKQRGGFVKPTLYDISDSSAWYNKCDHGLVVHRDFETGVTEVSVAKSRFHEAGEPGTVKMRFNRAHYRFETLNGDTEGGNGS